MTTSNEAMEYPVTEDPKIANLAVELHTDDYRGDHGADVVIAYEVLGSETLAELVGAIIEERYSTGPIAARGHLKPTDFIVIRPRTFLDT